MTPVSVRVCLFPVSCGLLYMSDHGPVYKRQVVCLYVQCIVKRSIAEDDGKVILVYVDTCISMSCRSVLLCGFAPAF